MRFNIYASRGHLGGTDAMPTDDEARFITTDGDLEVWQPLTWEGAVKLGGYGGVRAYWDTAAVSGHPRWFSMYADEGPLYIFIDKSNPLKKYQYHPATATFADIKDRVWTKGQVDEFFAEHPVAADSIGYGYSQNLMSDEQAGDMPYDDYGDDVEACGDIKASNAITASKFGEYDVKSMSDDELDELLINIIDDREGEDEMSERGIWLDDLYGEVDAEIQDRKANGTWHADDVEACGDINCATKYGADMCSIGASYDSDTVYRVIINDELSQAESCLDAEGCWYDYDGGNRMMVCMDGLNCLEACGIDYDEV